MGICLFGRSLVPVTIEEIYRKVSLKRPFLVASLIFLPVALAFDARAAETMAKKGCSLGPNSPHFITSAEAEKIETDVGKGNFDLNTFKKVWDKSCDLDVSLAISEKVKSKQADLDAFLNSVFIFTYACAPTKRTIQPKDAQKVAEMVAEKKLASADFLAAWKLTCDAEAAIKVAESTQRNEIDMSTFARLKDPAFAYRCASRQTTLSNSQLIDVSAAVKSKQLSLEKFMSQWAVSCNFSKAFDASKNSTTRETDDGGEEEKGTSAE